MATRARQIAKFMGKTETANSSNAALSTIDSSFVTTIVNASSLDSALVQGVPFTVFSSLDSLPTTNLDAGDKAYVTGNNRLYISNGSGWYNVALVNASPTLSISPSGAIELSSDGSTTTVTLTGTDSDNADANLTFSVESDGSFLGLGTIVQDSSVFTITPFSSDSATTSSSTLTFKVTDGINIASDTTAFSLTFLVSNSNKTTMLLKADDAATDEQVDGSSNTYSITENDAGGSSSGSGHVASSAFSPYHPGGYSTYFGGSEYMTFAGTSGSLLLGVNTNFTIEMWIYITNLSATRTIISQVSGGAHTSNLSATTSGELYLQIYQSSANRVLKTTSGAGITANAWYHIALTHEAANSGTGTAGKFAFFVNGTEVDSVTNASYSWYNGTDMGNMEIGRYAYSNINYYHGYITDFRITQSLVYTSNFTAPSQRLTAISNCTLLALHLPYFRDGSTNDTSYAIGAGNPETVRFGPYDYLAYDKSTHGGSVYFDGDADYFTVGSASDGALTGTFTIECWFMLKEAYSAKVHTLISNYDGGSDYWTVQIRNSGELWLAAAVGTTLSYTLNPLTNVWYHVAVSNNAAGNTGKLFVNGKEVDSHSSASIYDDADMAATSVPITIGRLGNNSTQDMYGYIADVRLLSGTHLRTAAFTPPTSPLTAITNTKVLTCNNKNDVWDQASGHIVHKGTTGTGVGLPASNVVRKWTGTGVSSIRAAILAHTMMKPLGPGDFTIEGWVYFDTNNDPHGIFHTGSGFLGGGATFNYANINGVGFGLNGSTGYYRLYHAGSATNSTQQAVATTWTHFAVVRNSGTIKVYINGTATSISVSNTTNFTEPDIVLGAFYDTSQSLAGYLQDFRISLFARYTSNFTAPTEAFEG